MANSSYDQPPPPVSPSTDTSPANAFKAARVLTNFLVKNSVVLGFIGLLFRWGYTQFDDRFQKLEASRQADHEAIMRLESNVDALCTVNGVTPYRRRTASP